LIANLVDNAIRHNIAGGQIEITTTSADGAARLAISNTGPAVPTAEIDRLFQSFQQVGSERVRHDDGHGLGLAIVRAVAQAHDAKITTLARRAGGLAIEVVFPEPPGSAQ
jgi:signal transduction histidine kinase